MSDGRQIPIRCAALIAAPIGSVRRALGRTQVWTRAARAVGGRLEVSGDRPTLVPGGLVRFHAGPGRTPVLLVVGELAGLPVLRSATAERVLRVEIGLDAVATAAGTLTTVSLAGHSRIPLLGSIFRPSMIRYGEMLLGITTLVAREPVRVVAAAVISDGKVLLARRKSPAGRWELPGGKVEPGESDRQALERELWEELALHATVSQRLGPMVEVEPGVQLVCYRAEWDGVSQIVLTDHDEYRWVGAEQLDSFDLLEADREFVDLLRITLQILP